MTISNREYVPHDTLYPQAVGLKLPTSQSSHYDEIVLDFYRKMTLPKVEKCLQALDALSRYNENWDGYCSAKPKLGVIECVKTLIIDMFNFSCHSNIGWLDPVISADSEGCITFEWWGIDDKKITIYISESSGKFEIIQSFNEIISDMKDRTVSEFTEALYLELFGWLL